MLYSELKPRVWKSTVTGSLIICGIFTLPVFFNCLFTFWQFKSNLKGQICSKLQLTLFCKTFSVSTEVSEFWNTLSVDSIMPWSFAWEDIFIMIEDIHSPMYNRGRTYCWWRRNLVFSTTVYDFIDKRTIYSF